MQVFAIPVGDNALILYRPLRQLAFVGNEAMARLVMRLADSSAADEGPAAGETASGRPAVDGIPPSIAAYLAEIGFLVPDPEPPAPRDPVYRPTSAVILATNRCNLRCVYCYASAGEAAGQEVSVAMARTAIDHVCQNARDLGRPHFELTFHGGGEPTLAWTTLTEAVDYARGQDLPCYVSLVSNGVWTERQRRWILDNVDRLTISFDGARETQDRQRPLASGRGTFEAVMQTIAELDRYGRDYGIRMTVLAPWEHLSHDVSFLCEETGCRSFQVEPAFNLDRGGYQAPSPQAAQEFVDSFMAAFEIVERAGRCLRFSGARPRTLTTTFCSAPFGALIVTPAGTLVTCYEVTDAQHPLVGLCTIGRLEDGASGARVVVDEPRRSFFLARLEARRQSCRECFCYWHCAGDCHVKAFYPGADDGPLTGTRCWMNRSITAQMLLYYIAASEDGVWRGKCGAAPGEGE